MTEATNLTLEEKKVNKDYILANVDKYIIDSRGNFYNIDLEILGDKRYYIGKDALTPEDYEEVEEKVIDSILKDRSRWSLISCEDIVQEIFEIILKEIDQWKITYGIDEFGSKSEDGFVHSSGAKIKISDFTWDQSYILLGELGFRKSPCWVDYDSQFNKKFFEGRMERYKCKLKKRKQERWKIQQNPSPASQTNTHQPTSTIKEEPLTPQEEQIKQAVESIQTQAEQNKKGQNSPNSSPTSPSSDQETTNSETSHSPLLTINTNAIKNSKNTAKDSRQILQQINKLLANKKIKTTDLPKKYQNWAEQIKKLTTKKEINAYVRKLEQVINKQKQSSSESKDLSFSPKLGIGVGVSLLITEIVFLLLKRRRNLNSKRENKTSTH